MNEIMVSICCLVYNHEKYLRQCLDGFVKQKTNFKFEVLIHDDASTDSSAAIVREYEEKYPDLIKPIYQTENQHSKGIRITYTYQYPRVTGKYIAFCEGDDYWSDENKLQKQFDLMEMHPECSLCVHRVQYVWENGKKMKEARPLKPMKSGMISQEDAVALVLNGPIPFQTTSYFCRKDCAEIDHRPEFLTAAPVGDVPRLLFLAEQGPWYYIDETMSCYRKGVAGSWTSRYHQDENFRKNMIQRIEKMCRLYDEYTGKKYSENIEKAIHLKWFELYVSTLNIEKLRSKEYRECYKYLPIKKRLACKAVCIRGR